jgi:hypothetical protein
MDGVPGGINMNRRWHLRCIEEETGLDVVTPEEVRRALGISEAGALFHEIWERCKERVSGTDLRVLTNIVKDVEEHINGNN